MGSYRRKRSTSRKQKAKVRKTRRVLKRRKPARRSRSSAQRGARTSVVKQLRKIAHSTAATNRAARLDAGGTAYIKLHSGRKRYLKGFVFKRIQSLNPLVRQTQFFDFTATDSQSMSINNYKETTDAINLCQWVSFAASTPKHIDYWIDLANKIRLDGVAATQSDNVYKRSCQVNAEFKNENKQPVEIDFWTFYPRRDIPKPPTVGYTYDPLSRPLSGDNSAVMPDLLYNAFLNDAAEATTNIYADAAPLYYQRDASPFQANQWCSMFRASSTKPRHITLQGGQSVKVSLTDWASAEFSMQKFGLFDGTTIAANYHFLRANGPVILARVRGCLIHDESKATTEMGNTDLNPAYGAFSVTANIQYQHHLTAPLYDPSVADMPKKIRMEFGDFGFSAAVPYNPITNIQNADTRDRNQTEGAFNT